MKPHILKFIVYITLVLFVLGAVSTTQAAPKCPAQYGYITFQLGEHGEGIGPIIYPCKFSRPPVLIVSPAQGQGTFHVTQFQANSLTETEGSVAVINGSPGAYVTFAWVASVP